MKNTEQQRSTKYKTGFKTLPFDYEKYKAIYKIFFKNLTMEQYKLCHQNGSEHRIERGEDIKVPTFHWKEKVAV